MSKKSKDNQTINIEQLNVINQVKEGDPSNKSENEQIDILNFLKDAIKNDKEIVATILTLIGIFITVSFYVYFQGYNSFFGIDDKWNNANDKSIYFKIVFPLCGIFIVLFPNLITAFPFILKRDIKTKIWYEILLCSISYGLVLCISSKIFIDCYILLVILFIIVIGATFLALIFSLENSKPKQIASKIIGIILILALVIYILCNHKMISDSHQFVNAFVIWFFMFCVAFPTLLCLPSKSEVNKNENEPVVTISNNNESDEKAKEIKYRNNKFLFSLVGTLFIFSFIEVLLYSDGQVYAENQKSFTVILLNEDEHYRNLSMNSTNISSKAADELLSDLPTDKEERNKVIDKIKEEYKDKPYIDIVEEKDEDGKKTTVLRRKVNAYIVIASSGDDSLVFNGYIDENNNIYYFSEEQRTIKTADYITNNMTFKNAIKG